MVIATARRAVLPALLALTALLALPHAAQAALTFGSCVDFNKPVRCATLNVPLDRTGVDPGTIPLRIARVGLNSGPTMMYLSGGPGGAGVSEMLGVVPLVNGLDKRFQIIGYDQRGTGRSGLLRCPALEKDRHLRSTSAAADCANRIGVARHHYTTPDSVEDMEAIRQQLGVEKLTLFGISYGTELAIAYARAHPDHVERLILDSTVDADDRDPFATVNFRAMGPTLQSLCPNHCRNISTNPGADLGTLVARLHQQPAEAFAYDTLGRSHRVKIGPVQLLDLMFDTDYLPPMRAAIPLAVRDALSGDYALLARLLRQSSVLENLGSPRDFSVARYSTVCETTPLPWDPGTPFDQRPAVTQQRIAAVPAGAFAPFDPQVVVEDEIDLCMHWPDVPRVPSTAPAAPYPAVPTLILQGGEDLRTPPEWSAGVASRIPGAVRLVVPGIGHSTVSDPRDCAADAIMRFVRGMKLPTSCKRIPTHVPPVPQIPRTFNQLRGTNGLPAKLGRTLTGVRATLFDLELQFSTAVTTSGGGLRGGSWAVRGGKLVLHDYQAVTGMTVSGGGDKVLTFRIAGTQAAHGMLTLNRRGVLSGRLNGRRVRLDLGSASAARVGTPRLPRFRLPH